MMDKIRLCTIDSGVNLSHDKLKEDSVQRLNLRSAVSDDRFGHGTAVYGILRSTRDIADILSIQFTCQDTVIEEDELIEILEYLLNHDCPDLINLSLGLNICSQPQQLYSLCQQFYERGTIILAAFDNAGAVSYPAAFDCVIGVTTGENCHKNNDFEYVEDTIVNLAAYGGQQRLLWTDPPYILMGGNSFACAHATVQAARYMAAGFRSFHEILACFRKDAVKYYPAPAVKQKKPLFRIKKAAVFPFNKEMHSLLRFPDLLEFEIIHIYDTKYSGTVGAMTQHLLKDNSVLNRVIENVHDIDWNDFDTLILGHTDELSALVKDTSLKEKIIHQALKNGKQIFSFDDISSYVVDANDSVYYPYVTQEMLPPVRFGMLYRIPTPVLAIFGTSSKQGKFTLQLTLRKKFLDHGFSVGQLGTEPSSLLFGMNDVFPMGYHSTVYIKDWDVIRYVNHMLNQMAREVPDILLVGSQSGTLPYDTGNITQYPILQHLLLLATQPDAVILCINAYDELDYIERTVRYIQSTAETTVIGLVIFPMDINSDWTGVYGARKRLTADESSLLKIKLQQTFQITAYNLGVEQDMDSLYSDIVSFYQSDD